MMFIPHTRLSMVKAILIGLVLYFGLAPVPSLADNTPLLTVKSGSASPLVLSLKDLDLLPQHGFETTTQWTEGQLAFSGPALKDVLGLVDAGTDPREEIHMIAANQYEVLLDPSLLEDDVPIVATRIDGKTYGIRDKGPLWVVFPYDLDTGYQREGIYSASIWQLIEISVRR